MNANAVARKFGEMYAFLNLPRANMYTSLPGWAHEFMNMATTLASPVSFKIQHEYHPGVGVSSAARL